MYQIKTKQIEKVDDFCGRFDCIIREYENCEGAVPHTEDEKKIVIYQAFSAVVSENKTTDFIKRTVLLKAMNLDKMKSYLMQLEAEKRDNGGAKVLEFTKRCI